MLNVKKYRSIKEIDSTLWDSINENGSYFKSYEFIQCVEDSNIEDSKFWYLLFYDEGKIVGATVLCSFIISLDLFLDKFSKKIVHYIRKIFPSFLNIQFLFCGIPISIGKDTLLIKDNNYKKEIINILSYELKQLSKSINASLISIKEYYLDYDLYELEKEGFIKSWSIPYFEMEVHWSSFNEYLKNLRHPFRRQILKSLDKVDFSVLDFNSSGLNQDHAIITIERDDHCTPEVFYNQYLQVMNHAEVVLETLNLSFFENLFKNCTPLDIISVRKDKTLGSAILIKENDMLVFLLVGINYTDRDKYNVYFNLVYAILMYAIKFGFKKIGLGQTSNYVKQRIGGIPKQMVVYNYSNSFFIRFLLKTFNKFIFPKHVLMDFFVFKKPLL